MEIKTRTDDMTPSEERDLAYWERNMLALILADGWYDDYVTEDVKIKGLEKGSVGKAKPREPGYLRVLSCFGGQATFHIPDDFDVGDLPQIENNWDGHNSEQKWKRVLTAARLSN